MKRPPDPTSPTPAWVRRALSAVSVLLPRRERTTWVDEWCGEIAAARRNRRVGLRSLLLAALSDALATVRHGRQLRRVRGSGSAGEAVAGDRERGTDGYGLGEGMGELWRDVSLGVRKLVRTPTASVAAVLTLGFGIGGTTAAFSVVDGVLLRPMSYPEADRLVRLRSSLSYDNFRDLQAESRALESIGLTRGLSVSVTGAGEPERIRGEYVTASYFDVLRARPALGRTISSDETVPGGPLTVVLSHGYWERRFGSDPSVVGGVLHLNHEPHTVVGVMPPDFRSYWDSPEAWISPQTMPYGGLSAESRGHFPPIARLAEGWDVASAERELDDFLGRLIAAGEYPDVDVRRQTNVFALSATLVPPDTRALLWWLSGAVGLVLLIAVANVAGLQLTRVSERSREMAIRASLGGGRGRLVRQLMAENLTLAAAGGVLGLGVALVAVRWIQADTVARLSFFDIGVDGLALAVTALATVTTGLLIGVVPAVRGSAAGPGRYLREDGRGGSSGARSSRFRAHLVSTQMAMAVTLLVGAALLLRNAAALTSIELGFNDEGVLTGETRLTAPEYEDPDLRRAYLERVVDRLAAMPGVRAATLVKGMPFGGDDDDVRLRPEGSDLEWEQVPWVFAPPVERSYFDLLGIPIVAGRGFVPTDGPTAEPVMILSRSLAEELFRGLDPVGGVVESNRGRYRIVGVAENTKGDLSPEPRRNAYVHYLQTPPSLFNVLIRTEGASEGFTRALLEAFWSVDANQPLWEIMPLADRTAAATRNERFFSTLVGGFASLALFLAGIGLYGVMAHTVVSRRRELGVRIALGADRHRIRRMLLAEGIALTGAGMVVGVGVAAGVARLLASILFGIAPYDGVSFVVGPGILAAVAAVAAYLPARRATHVEPMDAMRP